MVGCNPLPLLTPSGHQGSLLRRNGRKKEHGMLPVLSCTRYFQAPATQFTLVGTCISYFLTAAVKWCHIVVQNNGKEMYKKSVLHMQICCFVNGEEKCDVGLPW